MRSRSAAFELTLLTVLVMAILLVSFTWLSIRLQQSWLLDEVKRGLSLASDTLQSAMRDGMMQNRRNQILGTIERVSRDTRIKDIRIIDHRGQIKLSTNRDEIDTQLDAGAQPCSICHAGGQKSVLPGTLAPMTRTSSQGKTLRAFSPILAEPGCITSTCHSQEANSRVLGVIDLGLSLREVEEALAENQLKIGAASLTAILLGGGLLWLALAFRFSRPMSEVMSGIRRVASGDLNYRIPVHQRDEFGQLAASFNAMNQQLAAMQQGLIQSERLISMGKLAAGVAHEINNPLTGILSYAEDLQEGADPADPRRKDYEVIVREALRCRQIVRSLLDFARQDRPVRMRTHPRNLVERSLDVVARQATFRNIRFLCEIEDDLPAIEVDPTQIQQVMVNLIVNAQQAMPEGGKIVLVAQLSKDGSQVEFSVRDEGIGIPPEIRSHIFDPFFSTKGGKTDGLGLSICLGIVQSHGGTIDLVSEVGKGTTFRFLIPILKAKDPVPKEREY
jgi:two-component system NtrC family sensor kinase